MGARPSADPQGALGAALPQRHRQSSCLTFLDPDSRVGLAGCRRCPWERSNRDSVGPTAPSGWPVPTGVPEIGQSHRLCVPPPRARLTPSRPGACRFWSCL